MARRHPCLFDIEAGQRRVDLIQFLELAAAIGFDPHDAIRRLRGTATD